MLRRAFSIFHSFEAGIADAIASLKWMENTPMFRGRTSLNYQLLFIFNFQSTFLKSSPVLNSLPTSWFDVCRLRSEWDMCTFWFQLTLMCKASRKCIIYVPSSMAVLLFCISNILGNIGLFVSLKGLSLLLSFIGYSECIRYIQYAIFITYIYSTLFSSRLT